MLYEVITKAVRKADVIVGGRRQLELFKDLNKPEVTFNGKVADLKDKLLQLSGNVAIVVSGDTGFYSLRTFIKREFPNVPLQIEPGISSYQYLYAKVGLGYENACLASVHGKNFNFIEALLTYESVFLLTDRKTNWKVIAHQLVENNLEDCTFHIGNRNNFV